MFLQTFQKAVLVSIISVKRLFLKMQVLYAILFIMTYKLNQDLIENLFAVIRQNGGTHDHPSPLEALYRLRLVFLGKNLNQLKSNQNTLSNQVEEDFVMAKMFRKRKNCKRAGTIDSTVDALSDVDDDEPWQFVTTDRTLEEEDGAEYLAGFIARGVIKEFPDLANHTYKLHDESKDQLNEENYVQDLSYGGLMQPTEKWQNVFNQMDSYFNHIHNNVGPTTEKIGFQKTKNVQKRSIALIQNQFPDVPEKIVRAYANKRINVRVRHMQKRLQEKKIHKHKFEPKKKKGKENSLKQQKERNPAIAKNERKLKHIMN